MENLLSICKTFIFIWGLSGYWFFLIYLFIFFRWKIKNKHKMCYNSKLMLKWLILIGGAPLPLRILERLLISNQPLIYKQLVACLEMPGFLLYVFLIVYILYKNDYAQKYELFLPLFFWSPAMLLLIYKKVQTDLPLTKDSDLQAENTNTSNRAHLP